MIYLDNCATTKMDPRVLEAMLPYMQEKYGNPASQYYTLALESAEAVDRARESLAGLLNVSPGEIVFTSGATESINLAIKGAFHAYRAKGTHMVTAKTEHRAVLDCMRSLRYKGAEITELDVDGEGRIDLAELKESIRKDTILVAVMWVNNETGIFQDIDSIAELCRAMGTLFFTDATQAVGKMEIDLERQPVSMLACSAHKFHGPMGVGALFIRKERPKVNLLPEISGGGHQGGLRSGTLNVPGIVGMGVAASIAEELIPVESKRLAAMRDYFEDELRKWDGRVRINAGKSPRLGNISSISLPGVRSDDLIRACADKVAFSAGSACTAADPAPSHVLQAMGLDIEEARRSIRVSFGRFNTHRETQEALTMIRMEAEMHGTI